MAKTLLQVFKEYLSKESSISEDIDLDVKRQHTNNEKALEMAFDKEPDPLVDINTIRPEDVEVLDKEILTKAESDTYDEDALPDWLTEAYLKIVDGDESKVDDIRNFYESKYANLSERANILTDAAKQLNVDLDPIPVKEATSVNVSPENFEPGSKAAEWAALSSKSNYDADALEDWQMDAMEKIHGSSKAYEELDKLADQYVDDPIGLTRAIQEQAESKNIKLSKLPKGVTPLASAPVTTKAPSTDPATKESEAPVSQSSPVAEETQQSPKPQETPKKVSSKGRRASKKKVSTKQEQPPTTTEPAKVPELEAVENKQKTSTPPTDADSNKDGQITIPELRQFIMDHNENLQAIANKDGKTVKELVENYENHPLKTYIDEDVNEVTNLNFDDLSNRYAKIQDKINKDAAKAKQQAIKDYVNKTSSEVPTSSKAAPAPQEAFTGDANLEAIQAHINKPESKQGFTLNLNGEDIIPKAQDPNSGVGRYILSAEKNLERRFKPGKLTPEAIQSFIEENDELLRRPGHYLGGWEDADGNMVLDVSRAFSDRDEAERVADANDQEAMFDALDMQELPLKTRSLQDLARAHFDIPEGTTVSDYLAGDKDAEALYNTWKTTFNKNDLDKKLKSVRTAKAVAAERDYNQKRDAKAAEEAKESNRVKYIADKHYSGDEEAAKEALSQPLDKRPQEVNDTINALDKTSALDLHAAIKDPSKGKVIDAATKQATNERQTAARTYISSMKNLEGASPKEATDRLRDLLIHSKENPDIYKDPTTGEPKTAQQKQLSSTLEALTNNAHQNGADIEQLRHEVNTSKEKGYAIGSEEHKKHIEELNTHKDNAQAHYDHLISSDAGESERAKSASNLDAHRLIEVNDNGEPVASIHSKEGKHEKAGPNEFPHGVPDLHEAHNLGARTGAGNSIEDFHSPASLGVSDSTKEQQRIASGRPPGPPPKPGLVWAPGIHHWVRPETLRGLQSGLEPGESMFMPNGLHAGTDDEDIDNNINALNPGAVKGWNPDTSGWKGTETGSHHQAGGGVLVTSDGLYPVHNNNPTGFLGGHQTGSKISGASTGASTMSHGHVVAHALGSTLQGIPTKNIKGEAMNRIPVPNSSLAGTGIKTPEVKKPSFISRYTQALRNRGKGKNLNSATSRIRAFHDWSSTSRSRKDALIADVGQSLGREVGILQPLLKPLGEKMRNSDAYIKANARIAERAKRAEAAQAKSGAARAARQKRLEQDVLSEPEFR